MEKNVVNVISSKIEEEYALETERKRILLHKCGIAEEDLSKNGQLYLHILSECAAILQLKDISMSSYLMAMSDLEDELDQNERQTKELRLAVEKSQQRSQELLTEWKDLQTVKQQLEDAVDEREKHENTTTMEQRTAEYIERQHAYEADLESLQTALLDLDFDSIRDKNEHNHLSALDYEAKQIEAENQSLRELLRRYHGLPLNEDMAAAKLYEAKLELQQLEDQFNSQIREML